MLQFLGENGRARRDAVTKGDVVFREASRREDADLLRQVFPGPSQEAIAQAAARYGFCSRSQSINYLRLENDMPSWAVKALQRYLGALDRAARRIEGQ